MAAAPHHHDRAYFERMYRHDPDPWGFDSSAYERRKYDLTLAALPPGRFRRAFEPGCANGALTERLAPRCDELHAYDLLPEVAARARARLAGRPRVAVGTGTFPDDWPPGTGDLVVLSEVAYYCTPDGLEAAISRLGRWLEPGGTLLAVHYTGTTDYPLAGDAVHERLDRVPWLERRERLIDSRFRLDLWRRAGSP